MLDLEQFKQKTFDIRLPGWTEIKVKKAKPEICAGTGRHGGSFRK